MKSSEKYIYGAGYGYVLEVDDIAAVEQALGDLKKKAPATMKVAINATGRYARKLMVQKTKERYVLTAKGRRNMEQLKMVGKATNTNLSAKLHISSFRDDLSYFDVNPRKFYIGVGVARAPEAFQGRALKEESRKLLSGAPGRYSKAFLVPFKSGHIGMVQRQIGKESDCTTTARSGKPRWKSGDGIIEKLRTYSATSATSAHNTIWPIVQSEIGDFYYTRLDQQIDKVIAREVARKATRK